MCCILRDVSVRILTGLNGDDLDVDLHEFGGRGVVLDRAPARGLGHLAPVAHAGVRGETDWPYLPAELNRLGQGQNLMTNRGDNIDINKDIATLTAASGPP